MLLYGVGCTKKDVQQVYDNVEILSATKDDTVLCEQNDLHAYHSVLSAISYEGHMSSSIPIPGTWFIRNKYQNEYVHFYQMHARPEYPGAVLCGPTSYMLAAHMIAASKGNQYPVGKQKLGAIYQVLARNDRFDDKNGMYISDLVWFSQNYDYPVIKSSYWRSTNRSLTKEYIEYNLKTGYPVIVTVNIFGLQSGFWSNDGDAQSQLQKKYYIGFDGPVGHFILLIGIRINPDGTGTVWYKDPLSVNGETRSVSYTRLLNAMLYNGNPQYYDFVAVFE